MSACTRCGTTAFDDASFCSSCGFRLKGGTNRPPPAEAGGWPVVRTGSLSVSASVGGPLDLYKIAKALSNAKPTSKKISMLTISVKDSRTKIVIRSSGRMDVYASFMELPGGKSLYIHPNSESQARIALEGVVQQMHRAGVRFPGPFTVQATPVHASVFLGRGVDLRSLPERIPNSLYAQVVSGRTPNEASMVQGRYNRAGALFDLTSDERLGAAITEVSGGKFSRGSTLKLPHVAFCRLPDSPIVARMIRSLDEDGNMCMTGFATVQGARSVAEVQGSARYLGRMLEQAGLLRALTPLEKIPGWEEDPRAFDHFAKDSEVWS
jgi:TATA-box binding protein (TBP) (component of TFIID and TFIIIB)